MQDLQNDFELGEIGYGIVASQPSTEDAEVLGPFLLNKDANSVTATSSSAATKEKVVPRPHMKFSGVCP